MKNKPIQIFSDFTSPRLTYVLDFIFENKGISYEIVHSLGTTNHTPDIIYSTEINSNSQSIQASGLLSETNIKTHWKVAFDHKRQNWTINDIKDDFAIIFYFLSRYEEYTDKTRDNYDRFTAAQSILMKENQLHLPWCDLLVKSLWEKLGLDTNTLTKRYKTILTYDIDIAWAVKHKPIWRQSLNIVKSITKPTALRERIAILRNKQNDPYDSYQIIKENAKVHPTILFFLLGNYGSLDKNHPHTNSALQKLVQSFKGIAELGIHPSFQSYGNTKMVKEEQNRLANIINQPVNKSRQHFLRLKLPETYQILNNIGISEDFSMGYAEHFGFRAATSFPFHFFDLSTNQKTTLKVVPFTFMDGTLKEYMTLSPEAAINVIEQLQIVIKSVGGQFVALWHNHSISNQKEWKGWQKVYKACIT
ncbi:MAG: polysaccharide deacetylase family protein [Putridiphycobacter sp.]|nr:polysaccharide deacetylase family protein [Putridiphycobacter sp.]